MALSLVTRWSRSQNFCAVMLLLSPSFTAGFRTAAYSYVQPKYAGYRPRSQRNVIHLETLDSSYESENNVASNYKRGQAISFSVLRFGPMGASVRAFLELELKNYDVF